MLFYKNNLKLKLVEGFKMPDSTYDRDKKAFVKTGGEVQMYRYTFVENDEFRESITLVSSQPFASFEDKTCVVGIKLQMDDFTKKLKNPRLESVQLDPENA